MDRGYEIAETLQVSVDTKALPVRWAKHNGTVYRSALVVCVRGHCEMVVFQRIHHVAKDGKLLLVTLMCPKIFLDEHFSAFKVLCTKVRPHVVDVKELFSHKTFDIETVVIIQIC